MLEKNFETKRQEESSNIKDLMPTLRHLYIICIFYKKDSDLMEKTEERDFTTQKKKNITKFEDCSLFVQASFIIAIIMSVITLLSYGVYQWLIMGLFGEYAIVISYIIYSIFLIVAIIGTVFGEISFKEGKNIYDIIGFIVNLLIIGAMAFYIYLISEWTSLY